MRFSAISFLPCLTLSGVQPLSTSSCFSLSPISTPKAMAIGKPIIPVPGIPTPIAFLSTLALSRTSIRSGVCAKSSLAFAAHSATAIGSVHPMAGTTCRCISSRMAFLSFSDSMVSLSVVFVYGVVKACSKNSPQRFNCCSLSCSSPSFCFFLASFAFSFRRIVHYAPSSRKQHLLS